MIQPIHLRGEWGVQQEAPIERVRPFVGRESELDLIRAWLDQSAPAERLVALHGLGGIGKTTLMRRMTELARARAVGTAWLDARSGPRTPQGFREVVAATIRVRTLLCIDNYEALAGIEDWLREECFFELLDAGVFIVAASRQGPSLAWMGDAAWRERLIPLPLGPLTRREALAFLARVGMVADADAAEILTKARGLPLALALSVSGSVGRSDRGDDLKTAAWRAIGPHLLGEVQSPELQSWLDVLAIVPEANSEMLAAVALTAPTAQQYHALAELSFMGSTERGLALHDVVREHLLDGLRRREPGRMQALRRRAVDVLRRQLPAAGAQQRRQIASQLLSICRDGMPSLSWGDLTLSPDAVEMGEALPTDLPDLHRFIEAWGRPAALPGTMAGSHALLDAMADRFPATVRVARAPGGRPLAFVVTTLLFSESVALIDTHLDHLLERLLPQEIDEWRHSRRENADTYFFTLIGMDPEETGYGRPEILGCLVRELLLPLGEGTRLVAVLVNPNSKALFAKLGARRVASTRADECGNGPDNGLDHARDNEVEVVEIDLRRQDFAAWVSRFLMLSEGAAPRIAVDEVREAFERLHEPDRLEGLPLAARLGCTGLELAARLRRLLIAVPPSEPLDEAQQALLNLVYVQLRTAQSAARELHVSRATYFRHLQRALGNTARVLDGIRS